MRFLIAGGAVTLALLLQLCYSYHTDLPKLRYRSNRGLKLRSTSSLAEDDDDFGTRTGFRSSFISILGNPNVGKSTLLNAMLGEALCITSPKPQTTRHRILGVATNDEKNYQFVFSDTPGMLKPAYALQETMAASVRGAVGDGDIILLVTDVYGEHLADEQVYANIIKSGLPVIVAINKLDLVSGESSAGARLSQEEEEEEEGEGTSDDADAISKVQAVLESRPKSVFSRLRRGKSKQQQAAVAAAAASAAAVGVGDDADADAGKKPQSGPTAPNKLSAEGGSGLDQDQIDFIVSANREQNEASRDRGEKLSPKGPDELAALWQSRIPRASCVLLSASKGWGVDALSNQLLACSPLGPKYFPSDTLTDRDERFFASEIIREAILELYSDEIPYSCEVRIDSFRDKKSETLSVIDASIMVSRESQKGIIIGRQGAKLKELGQDARLRLERFLERGVYLNLRVKVDKDWRSSKESLERYEYL